MLKLMRKRKAEHKSVMTATELLAILLFGRIALKIVKSLNLDKKAIAKNIHIHPIRVVSLYLFYIVLYYLMIVPIIIMSNTLLPSYLWLIFAASALTIPALSFLVKLASMSSVDEIQSKISNEILLFSLHLAILARSGTPLEEMIRKLASSRLYTTIAGYMERVLTFSRLMGQDILTAIEHIASIIPHITLQSLLTGFVSALRSRSNISDYVEKALSMVFEHYKDYVQKVKSTANSAATIYVSISFMIIFLNIMYSLQVTGSVGSMFLSPIVYFVLSVFIVPMILLVLIIMVYSRVPKYITDSKTPFIMFTVFLPMGVGISLIARTFFDFGQFDYAITISLALLVPLAIAGIYSRRVGRDFDKYLRDFLELISDIATERRLGLPLEHIILNLSESYGTMNKALRRMKMALRTGVPVDKGLLVAFSDYPHRIIRFFASLLADAIVYGTATAEVLVFMAKSINEIINVIRETRSELRTISYLPYMVTVIVIVSSIGLGSAMSSLSSFTSMSVSTASMKVAVPIYSGIGGLGFAIGVIATTMLSGFLIGVMYDQRLSAGFFHAFLLDILLLVSFLFTPTILSMMGIG